MVAFLTLVSGVLTADAFGSETGVNPVLCRNCDGSATFGRLEPGRLPFSPDATYLRYRGAA